MKFPLRNNFWLHDVSWFARSVQCDKLTSLYKLVSVSEHLVFNYKNLLTVPWLECIIFFIPKFVKKLKKKVLLALDKQE